MRLADVASLCIALVGCQTAPQTPRPTAADDPSNACFEALSTDARFPTLFSKIPAGTGGIGFAHLTNAERVSDGDKGLISQWAAARKECADRGEVFRRTYGPPGWDAAYAAGQVRYMDGLADLYNGKITYGDFNKRRQESASITGAQLDEAQRRAVDREAAQRRDTFNDYLLLRSLQARPAPQVNCTTRHIGATAYTSCQ